MPNRRAFEENKVCSVDAGDISFYGDVEGLCRKLFCVPGIGRKQVTLACAQLFTELPEFILIPPTDIAQCQCADSGYLKDNVEFPRVGRTPMRGKIGRANGNFARILTCRLR